MSLALLAGKVGRLSQGVAATNNSVVNFVASDSNDFKLRNENSLAMVNSIVSNSRAVLDNVFRAVGSRPKMYTIGEVDQVDSEENLGVFYGGVASNIVRAVSSVVGNKAQTGVIIDGYDNIQGSISVALAENPVMYSPNITDHRVRTPNILKMRVYVSNLNTDNILDNAVETLKNAFGGAGNMIFGEGDSRATKALSSLQWIQENGIPFTVYTPTKVWENMMIKDISVISNRQFTDMLVADITFKEIIFYHPLDDGQQNPARKPPTEAANSIANAAGWVADSVEWASSLL